MIHKKIYFTKMHGLGNDFVVINALQQEVQFSKARIQELSNRYLGIGFDQMLLIKAAENSGFFCHILNADGSEAEQCGNGLRCVARFLYDEKLISEKNIKLETRAGLFSVDILDQNNVSVLLGKAKVHDTLKLKLNNQQIEFTPISIGNPHAILKVESLADVKLQEWAEKISSHDFFPHGANVGFMEIINRSHIRLRTYERGVGETLACGSNACAAVSAGIFKQFLSNRVKVEFRYGALIIEQKDNGDMLMTGPTTRVFDGVIDNSI